MGELFCRVTPNARRHEIIGWETDEMGREVLRVKLKAPPVEGKANRQIVLCLASLLGVPKSHVCILAGEKSRVKRIEVDGLTDAEVRERVAAHTV